MFSAMRRLSLVLLGMAGFGASTGLAINITERQLAVSLDEPASPTAPGSFGAALVAGPDGTVYLSWREPGALKFAAFDAAQRRWGAPRTIVADANRLANGTDAPVLAVAAGGKLAAVWPARGQAEFSESADGGATWSPPRSLSTESAATELGTVVALADGRFLAAWLDGRAKTQSGGKQRLFARILGRDGADQLVDASVCDCCAPALVPFPDGSALLAYRGRTTGEVRDHFVARFDNDQWTAPASLGGEGWKIAGCPVNGPRLATDGPHVGAAWYTAAGDEPRVYVSTSPNAGTLWALAQRADLGRPAGRVDTLLLRDGSQYVLWVENRGEDDSQPAGIYLRRYNVFGGAMKPARLADVGPAQTNGFPRIALAKEDNTSGPAQLLLVYTQTGAPSRVRTVLVTLPAAAELYEIDRDCECSEGKEILGGYGVIGRIVAVDAERRVMRVQHGPIPGLMRAGELEVRVAPAVAAAVQADRGFLGRLEKRGGEWWVFDVRLMAER